MNYRNKYLSFFIIIFLCIGCIGFSQSSPKLDSLLFELRTMPSDSNKVNTYSKVFEIYIRKRKENEKSKLYADSIITLSKAIKYNKGIADAHYQYSRIDQFEGNFPSAIEHLNQYLKHYEKKNDSLKIAKALFAIGKAYKSMGSFDNSLLYLYRCAMISEKLQFKKGLARAYNSIGSINKQLNNYDDAIKYYSKANEIYKELNYIKDYAMGLQNIGNVHNGGTGNYKMAINYYKRALDLVEGLNVDYEKSIILGNLGSVYNRLNQNDLALDYHLKSYEIKKSLPNKRTQAFALTGIGNTYLNLKNYKKSLEALNNGMKLAIEIGSKDIVAEIFNSKASLFKVKGDYINAYKNIELSHQWRDSIFNEKTSKQLSELQTKYETAKKDQEITLLTKEKEIQEKEARRKSILNKAIIGGLAFVLLVAGLLFYMFRQKVNNQKIVSKKNAQIKEVNYKQQLSELEMKALRAQMNPHFVFNCLNSINRMILGGDIKDASSYLTKFSRLIRKVLENSEKNMVSVSDELTMLKAYIQLESLRFKGKITYKTDIDKTISLEATFIPSMVLQPLIENAIWHGLMHKDKGGTIMLSIIKQDDVLKCSVEDNGIGRTKSAILSDKSVIKQKSMGLKLTSERLKIMSKLGLKRFINIIDLTDENNKGIGTRVDVLIPLT